MSTDRLDRMEKMLEIVIEHQRTMDEHIIKFADALTASDQRLTRIEQGLETLTQTVQTLSESVTRLVKGLQGSNGSH